MGKNIYLTSIFDKHFENLFKMSYKLFFFQEYKTIKTKSQIFKSANIKLISNTRKGNGIEIIKPNYQFTNFKIINNAAEYFNMLGTLNYIKPKSH